MRGKVGKDELEKKLQKKIKYLKMLFLWLFEEK